MTIRKVKTGYRLVSKTGRNLGTSKTKAGAKKRERVKLNTRYIEIRFMVQCAEGVPPETTAEVAAEMIDLHIGPFGGNTYVLGAEEITSPPLLIEYMYCVNCNAPFPPWGGKVRHKKYCSPRCKMAQVRKIERKIDG